MSAPTSLRVGASAPHLGKGPGRRVTRTSHLSRGATSELHRFSTRIDSRRISEEIPASLLYVAVTSVRDTGSDAGSPQPISDRAGLRQTTSSHQLPPTAAGGCAAATTRGSDCLRRHLVRFAVSLSLRGSSGRSQQRAPVKQPVRPTGELNSDRKYGLNDTLIRYLVAGRCRPLGRRVGRQPHPSGAGAARSALPRSRSGDVRRRSVFVARGWVRVDHLHVAVKRAHHPRERDLDRVSSLRLRIVWLSRCRGRPRQVVVQVRWRRDDPGCWRSVRLVGGGHAVSALRS